MQAVFLSVLRQKDDEKGRQECLPHLQTRFLNSSTSHCAGAVLLIGLLIFAVVTVIVGIGGFFDVRSLFESIDRQHRIEDEKE